MDFHVREIGLANEQWAGDVKSNPKTKQLDMETMGGKKSNQMQSALKEFPLWVAQNTQFRPTDFVHTHIG